MKSLDDVVSRYGAQFLLLLLVAGLSGATQLLLKSGLSQGGPVEFGLAGLADLLRRIFTTPRLLAGYAVGGVTGLLWLTALSCVEISVAAPAVTGLYFVLMLVGSRIFLAEAVTAGRWAGVVAIVGGIVLLSRR